MKTVDCRYCYTETFKIAHARKTCLCLKLDIVKIVNFFKDPGHVYGLELSKLLKPCKASNWLFFVANFVLSSQHLGIFFLLPLFIIV